jgi:hypothetical protein
MRPCLRSAVTVTFLLAAAACGFGGRAAGQNVDQPHRVWLGAGMVGAGSTSDVVGSGTGPLAQLVYQRAGHHLALRGLGVVDRHGNWSLGEMGLNYGRMITTRSGHAALAAGLAGLAFGTCPDDDDACFTFGFPVFAEMGFSREFIGVGLQAFANLNPKASYGGLALFVQFGRL